MICLTLSLLYNFRQRLAEKAAKYGSSSCPLNSSDHYIHELEFCYHLDDAQVCVPAFYFNLFETV